MSQRTHTLALPRVSLLVIATAVLSTLLFSGCITAVAPESSNTNTQQTQSTPMEKDDAMMSDEEKMDEEASMMDEDDMEMEGDAMMEKDDAMMEDKAMEAKGEYVAYDPSGSQLAKANSGDVVLFFHAAWCPSCRGTDADINANLSSIPANTHILKVDYDTATDLKNKYGVTYQHTFVQVDADGNQIKKWNGSPTLAALVSEIE